MIRVMPNTPCLVSESAAAFALGAHAKQEDRELVQSLLSAVGYACEVKESQLDGENHPGGGGKERDIIVCVYGGGGVAQRGVQLLRGSGGRVLVSPGEHLVG